MATAIQQHAYIYGMDDYDEGEEMQTTAPRITEHQAERAGVDLPAIERPSPFRQYRAYVRECEQHIRARRAAQMIGDNLGVRMANACLNAVVDRFEQYDNVAAFRLLSLAEYREQIRLPLSAMRETPAMQVTKDGPAYLLPGVDPAPQVKGDATQTAMF
jgi:hypothetical protein